MGGNVGGKVCGPGRLGLGWYRSRGCWSGLLLDPRVDLIGLLGLHGLGWRLIGREVIEEFVGLGLLGRRRRRVSRSWCDSIDQSYAFEPLRVKDASCSALEQSCCWLSIRRRWTKSTVIEPPLSELLSPPAVPIALRFHRKWQVTKVWRSAPRTG